MDLGVLVVAGTRQEPSGMASATWSGVADPAPCRVVQVNPIVLVLAAGGSRRAAVLSLPATTPGRHRPNLCSMLLCSPASSTVASLSLQALLARRPCRSS